MRYAKERVQWGKPIATYQLVQEKIAKMYTARSVDPRAAHAPARGRARGRAALASRRRARRSSIAPASTTEVALEAVQLKGGAGYMQDGVVEMLARDAKLLQIGGGTDEIQILRIAREVLEKA